MKNLRENLTRMSSSIYLDLTLEEVPRLLGLMDRNPNSRTYGCFDRQYWHYHVSDFSSARYQEAALTLALLYKIDNKKNPYYSQEQILNWCNAALNFWLKIQEDNGSFNEWYPYESSFVATSFSSYAVSETLLLLGDEIAEKEKVISALKKTGNWIMKKREKRAVNQETGAAISLYNLYLLTNEDKYKKAAEEKIKFIIKNQMNEGWFMEYGGADVGYLSLTVDYLAKYYQKTKDKKVLEGLEKAINFLVYFIHPNLTFGGEYGSRNTEYLIPHGFEILSKKLKQAELISYNLRQALKNKSTLNPTSLDDRYLSYITYTYLQAFIDSKALNLKIGLPYQKNFVKHFSQSGLWIYNNENIHLIVNYKKGGVFKIIFKENKKSLFDSGITIELANEKKFISNWLTKLNNYQILKNGINIRGKLWQLPEKRITPVKNILLRAFQLTIGRNDKIGGFVKERLRDKLITKAKEGQIKFLREIRVRDKMVEIIDQFDNKEIKKVVIGGKASYIYVPSSRYFQISELESVPLIHEKREQIKNLKKIKIIRQYNSRGKLLLR